MLRCTSFDRLIRQLGCFGTSHGTSPRPRRTRRSFAGETTDEDGRVGGVAGRNRQRWEHPESAGDQRSPEILSAAAREAVKQWRFERYYKSGQADIAPLEELPDRMQQYFRIPVVQIRSRQKVRTDHLQTVAARLVSAYVGLVRPAAAGFRLRTCILTLFEYQSSF